MFFQIVQHCKRHQYKSIARYITEVFRFGYHDVFLVVTFEERNPCQVNGNGRGQNDNSLHPTLFVNVFTVIVCHSRFATALLPVEQVIVFLKN